MHVYLVSKVELMWGEKTMKRQTLVHISSLNNYSFEIKIKSTAKKVLNFSQCLQSGTATGFWPVRRTTFL